MTGRARAAHEIWRARRARSTHDRLYLAYAAFMVLIVAVAPVVRMIWFSATNPAGIALLTSSAAPGVTVLVTAALWSSALLMGRDRGPALLQPFPTYALGTSDLSRSEVLCAPLTRAGALVTALTTLAADLVGGSLASHGLTGALGFGLFVLVGMLVGVMTTVAWLAGQALPRIAIPVALGTLGAGVLAALVPAIRPFVPWGWVGLTYPSADTLPPSVIGLAALTMAGLALVPTLLGRLHLADLMAQTTRWESASTFAASLDLGTAAAAYQRRPHLGRRLRAVRPTRSLTATFLIRDATGAIRSPGRLIVGVLALAAAGTLIAFAFAPTAPVWMLGACAGLLLFAGLGPLTDGIHHAASVASDLPLYGIGDGHLLASHALFPFAVLTVVLLVVVIVCVTIIGIAAVAPTISAVILGVLGLLTRTTSALKGPMPSWLLTPIATPVGDLSAAVRVVWSLDGLLLATAGGASAVLAVNSPLLLMVTAAILVGVGIHRWWHRG